MTSDNPFCALLHAGAFPRVHLRRVAFLVSAAPSCRLFKKLLRTFTDEGFNQPIFIWTRTEFLNFRGVQSYNELRDHAQTFLSEF